MSAFHKHYVTVDDFEVMWAIWLHITDTRNNAIEIVNDGVRDAVWIDPNEDDAQVFGLASFTTGNTFQTHAGLTAVQVKVAASETLSNDEINGYTITCTSGLHNGEVETITDSTTAEVVTVASWATKALSGNHTINATVNVAGDGSALYTTELAVGDLITINAEQKEVASITDFQTLTVTAAYAGSTTTTGTLDHPSGSTTYNTRSFGSYTTPTKKEAFVQGSFMVIQPSFPNPSEETGTAQAGSVTGITLAVADLQADGYYTGNSIEITSGAGSGQTRFISTYTNSTNIAAVTVNWSPAPDVTSVYSISRRWQCKLYKVGATDHHASECSPNGGFTMASATSGDTDDFGTMPTTDPYAWLGSVPQTGDLLYISTDDSDTYSGGAEKYGYFRAVFRDVSTASVFSSIYVGGYIPFDTVNDTDPFLLLQGQLVLNVHTTNDSWGNDSTAYGNRTPGENGKATSSLVGANGAEIYEGNQHLKDIGVRTRAGAGVTTPLYVHTSTGKCLGYLGANTMVANTAQRSKWASNRAGTLMSINDIALSWFTD